MDGMVHIECRDERREIAKTGVEISELGYEGSRTDMLTGRIICHCSRTPIHINGVGDRSKRQSTNGKVYGLPRSLAL